MKNDNITNKLVDIENKLDTLITKTVERPAPFTLHAWLDEWLKVTKPPTLSKKWLDCLRCNINRLQMLLPDRLLNEYNVADFATAIYSIPMSYTRSVCYGVLWSAYSQAVKLGYVSANPLDCMARVKHTRKKGRALTLDEQRQFLQAIENNPRRALYLFYLLSGVRCSEALALRWSDIDYNGGRIHIQGTKTPRSNRYIPLFPQICAVLADLPRNSEFVFPYSYYAVKSHFQRLKRIHDLNFRLHDLRHTFATRCIESGISIFTVSKWLGHTSITTTAGVYAHLLTDFERQEVQRFDPKI